VSPKAGAAVLDLARKTTFTQDDGEMLRPYIWQQRRFVLPRLADDVAALSEAVSAARAPVADECALADANLVIRHAFVGGEKRDAAP
jgi:hypothetical protein